MEQSSEKKARIMLAAGLAAALSLAAVQRFSPAARALSEGRDLRVVLLGENSPVMLIYHPAASTVEEVSFPPMKKRKGASGYQRATELSALKPGPRQETPGEVFYVSLSSAPEMKAMKDVMDGWRSQPRKLAEAAAWAARLREEGNTNISSFDLFTIFSEFVRLRSSNFELNDEIARSYVPAEEGTAEEAGPQPVLKVEVFNASDRKGLADRTAKFLRAAGFDVLTVSSYGKIEKRTIIQCFSSDTKPALKLRAALGLGGLEIHVKAPRRSVAAAAVILGADFKDGVLKE